MLMVLIQYLNGSSGKMTKATGREGNAAIGKTCPIFGAHSKKIEPMNS